MSRLRVHITFSNLHNQCRVDYTMKLDNHYQLNINHLKKAAIRDVWDNITVGETDARKITRILDFLLKLNEVKPFLNKMIMGD